MQTPRDVLRLRARLAVIASHLQGEVSPADLLLVEALSLKAPEVVAYVDSHRAYMLTARQEQYDSDQRQRGHFGDPIEDVLLRESERQDLLSKLVDGWKQYLPTGPFRVAVNQAMAFLLDCAQRTEFNVENHATRLRIQRQRNWNAWRCAFSVPEFFANAEVLTCLAIPYSDIRYRVLDNPQTFFEFCVLASDLADDSPAVDVTGVVDLMIAAFQKFGDEVFDRVELGFGPINALESVLRKEDDSGRRRDAIERLFDGSSVWVCAPIVRAAYREAFGGTNHRPEPESERLIPEPDVVRVLAERWIAAAIAALDAMSAPNGDLSGASLCRGIALLGQSEQALSSMSGFVRTRDNALNLLFSDNEHSDERVRDWGPPEITKNLDPALALGALARSPGFEESHRRLVDIWRSRNGVANGEGAAPDSN